MMKVILPPAGFYPNTPSSYSLLEAIHYLSPFVAHAVPSLIGGPLAALVAASHRMNCALVAGDLHLCGVPAGRKRALCAGGEAMSGTPGLGTLPRPSGRQFEPRTFMDVYAHVHPGVLQQGVLYGFGVHRVRHTNKLEAVHQITLLLHALCKCILAHAEPQQEDRNCSDDEDEAVMCDHIRRG